MNKRNRSESSDNQSREISTCGIGNLGTGISLQSDSLLSTQYAENGKRQRYDNQLHRDTSLAEGLRNINKELSKQRMEGLLDITSTIIIPSPIEYENAQKNITAVNMAALQGATAMLLDEYESESDSEIYINYPNALPSLDYEPTLDNSSYDPGLDINEDSDIIYCNQEASLKNESTLNINKESEIIYCNQEALLKNKRKDEEEKEELESNISVESILYKQPLQKVEKKKRNNIKYKVLIKITADPMLEEVENELIYKKEGDYKTRNVEKSIKEISKRIKEFFDQLMKGIKKSNPTNVFNCKLKKYNFSYKLYIDNEIVKERINQKERCMEINNKYMKIYLEKFLNEFPKKWPRQFTICSLMNNYPCT